MAFTFNTTLPTNRDRVRLKLGDTNSADPKLQDETIDYILTQRPDVLPASIECCRAIMGRVARDHDRTTGAMSSSVSEVFDQYKELLASLEAQYSAEVHPFLGGASLAAIQTIEANTDFRPMSFGVGRDDNKGASFAPGSNGQIQTP